MRDIAERADYHRLVTALQDRFDPIRDMGVYLAQLGTRTRKKGEGLMELSSSVQRLMEQVLAGLHWNVSNLLR
jgi:hypothetical protein